MLDSFHPAVKAWFNGRFDAATDAQLAGWRAIGEGRDTLVAAPTGSGKTLTAFLWSIDSLFRRGIAGEMPQGIDVVYVSPLKALSSDIQRNLEAPLAEIRDMARDLGVDAPDIRTALRTGDTTQSARAAILRAPPHILITTPESLYLMLTAERTRALLRNVRTVIVDELHALMRDKRGSHLALSLARLDALCEQRPVRIGLSATVHPIEEAARFLTGTPSPGPLAAGAEGEERACTIVNVGHRRDLDLLIEVPASTELQAVAAAEQWAEVYDRIAELIAEHRTTLVFVNTRRMAERIAHNLAERLGEEHVAAHHGSLSKDRRLRIEQRLKDGEMRAIVATASLELGIDVGTVDLVVQIGSPRAMTTFLQRIGRSGHALGLTSRGRLFATSRDELVECAALMRAVRAGRLDRVWPPVAPLDILAQQVVAECATREWREDELYDLFRTATPYASLTRADFDDVVEMLSEGPAPSLGRGRAYLHRDRIAGVLRGRRNARMTAITCGGAIPEVADYRVVLDPDETFIGTVNEDWAIESMAGDIFLLGSHSWQIRRIESARGVMRVVDAQGRPPSVPFWLGEAPSRTWELSEEVSRLRRDVAERLGGDSDVVGWVADEANLDRAGATQLVEYIAAEQGALGIVPSDSDIVFERFFDDAGGMQLVVHAPFGGRVNRGFGLALRKRFCVNFDFELQAAATDDAVVLSLGPQHSFPLEDAFSFVRSANVRESLEQAILIAPMFGARWRWNATRSLAVLRSNAGKQVPPPIQRMRSDDLMTAVFPLLTGCQENVSGPLEIPDHPLTRQTVNDCLYEAMDIDRLTDILQRMERGEIRMHARDTTEPSPFAHEILNARPYAYLEAAPLDARPTRAVSLRRTLPANARDLGALDEAAIERVREEARLEPRDADELHDLLHGLVAVAPNSEWQPWFDELTAAGRAAAVVLPALTAQGGCATFWFAAEHVRSIDALYPDATIAPTVTLPFALDGEPPDREDAVLAAVRGHMEYLGPVTPAGLASMLSLGALEAVSALARLEGEGVVLRGRFTPQASDVRAPLAAPEEFCDRRLLARIHRYTLDRLRSEIEPVSAQDFMRYLLHRQHLGSTRRLEGKRGVLDAIAQLQGFEIPAIAWERDVLPQRVADYNPQWLDDLCLAGDVAWVRLAPKKSNGATRGVSASRATPITLALRRDLPSLLDAARGDVDVEPPTTGDASAVYDALKEHGALFFDDLVAATRVLPVQLEEALWDLVGRGIVTADGFAPLRQIMTPKRASEARRHARYGSQRVGRSLTGPQGRWSLVRRFATATQPEELAERAGMQLLARYGVVFRDLVAREHLGVPWRDIVRALRRQEARGVVRGGRFVAGFVGEQYALPEAVDALRRVRKQERSEEIVRVNAADPLNLAGVITPGPRVAALHSNAVTFRDGLPVAIEEGRSVRSLDGDASDALAAIAGAE
jgi:ATP-dependent Lhr-like helicase